ncbi:unnamed protein product [Oppiella nova]|uniref:Uncharacterized protein n=1 Tax=Oppiella nova TaxID=334625 RepID=A0A7R9M825_9ACAR|nr:unnamed protein product [Oppiella nova]CAG2172542.1 unnamed protein product [Oppiella nova]
MVTKLKEMGYRVTLWVYPFVNTDSEVFAKESQYFIKAQNGSTAVNGWWNGNGAHVDFTNKKAQEWFVSRLKHIQNTTGIDSFKFDAGELGWVSRDFKLSDLSIEQTPVSLTQLYAQTVSQLGNLIETRVGYKTQDLPIFVRMLDKNSEWELAKNAVKTGEPIMRPIWWIAPNDVNTFSIEDQYLVGNDLLVAPVVTENARKRNIYLPSGQWQDHRGVLHTGPTTLVDFKAELNELPFFFIQKAPKHFPHSTKVILWSSFSSQLFRKSEIQLSIDRSGARSGNNSWRETEPNLMMWSNHSLILRGKSSRCYNLFKNKFYDTIGIK